MGKIILGTDRVLHRRVAIKILRDKMLERRDVMARFRIEAQVVAQLEHPAIIPVYSAEETDDGAPGFSMKFVRGKTLTDYVDDCIDRCTKSDNPDDEHSLFTRLDVFVRVCEAMEYAHARGVLHRDIKPDNVMIGRYRDVYVMDWGIASIMDQAEDEGPEIPQDDVDSAHSTRYGDAIGTVTHMAPEQARGELERVGKAADQYALGMILHELVTLCEPRPYEGDMRKIQRQAREGYVTPVRHRYDRPIPAGLRAIIEKATHKEPGGRYRSVADLTEDVRRYIRGDSLEALPDTFLGRLGKFMARNPAVVLAVVLVLAVTAGTFEGARLVAQLNETEERKLSMEVRNRELRHLSDLTDEVAMMATKIDRGALSMRLSVERIAAATATLLDEDLPLPANWASDVWYTTDAFERGEPPETRVNPHYGMKTSVVEPVVVFAPGTEAAGRESLKRLGPIKDVLRVALGRQADRNWIVQAPESVDSGLHRPDRVRHVSYVSLENGLLVNLPGYTDFDPEYDPRLRPWYVAGKVGPEARFGAPYKDVSGTGYLTPCNAGVFDREGNLLGVAGVDLRQRDFAPLLDGMERMEGFRYAAVVRKDGAIVVRTDEDYNVPVEKGLTEGNRTKELETFNDKKIITALASGRNTGYVVHDDSVVVYTMVRSLGWWLVAEFDHKSARE